MTIDLIRDKEERTAVGLMSGTSCDGIDAALVSLRGSGKDTRVRLVDFATFPYDAEMRRRLLDPGMDVREVCLLNFLLGEKMAGAASTMVGSAEKRGLSVDFIASHGHTAAHHPPGGGRETGTLQIGEPAVIAERTGLPVVSDFRPRDMAAGGQGAPLVPYADWILFRKAGPSTLCLNIGGIANLTRVTPDLDGVIAFDTGPGNMIIDGAVRMLSGGRMKWDEDGKAAAAGRVIDELLAELLSHPFFGLPPPKSAGREQFGPEIYLADALSRFKRSSFEDIIATVTTVVARSITGAVERFVEPLGRSACLAVSGGGAFNGTLLCLLRQGLPHIEVSRSDDLGIACDAKEAVAFAVLGNETIQGAPANVPAATGARRPVVLGKITPP